jgi:hypothetical protein
MRFAGRSPRIICGRRFFRRVFLRGSHCGSCTYLAGRTDDSQGVARPAAVRCRVFRAAGPDRAHARRAATRCAGHVADHFGHRAAIADGCTVCRTGGSAYPGGADTRTGACGRARHHAARAFRSDRRKHPACRWGTGGCRAGRRGAYRPAATALDRARAVGSQCPCRGGGCASAQPQNPAGRGNRACGGFTVAIAASIRRFPAWRRRPAQHRRCAGPHATSGPAVCRPPRPRRSGRARDGEGGHGLRCIRHCPRRVRIAPVAACRVIAGSAPRHHAGTRRDVHGHGSA